MSSPAVVAAYTGAAAAALADAGTANPAVARPRARSSRNAFIVAVLKDEGWRRPYRRNYIYECIPTSPYLRVMVGTPRPSVIRASLTSFRDLRDALITDQPPELI